MRRAFYVCATPVGTAAARYGETLIEVVGGTNSAGSSAPTVWATVEWPALLANPNVTSIVAVDPARGVETVLMAR